jgi:hypothetical protein
MTSEQYNQALLIGKLLAAESALINLSGQSNIFSATQKIEEAKRLIQAVIQLEKETLRSIENA